MIIDFIYGNGGGSGSGSTGPQGPQGPQGYQGADGQNGADGINGQDGAQGPQGEVGPQGAEGAQGPAGQNGTDGVQGPEGPQGATGAQGPQGPAGEGGSGSQDFIHLDNLNTAGESGKTYEYNGVLLTWNPNSGYTAEWLKPMNTMVGKEGTGLIYSYIPDGTTLFEYKQKYNGDYRKVVYSADTLYLMETAGTVVCAVTVGNTFRFTATWGSGWYIDGIFQKNYIGFFVSNTFETYFLTQNVWDGSVNGGHYELIDKYNYPYLGASDTTMTGIPRWNGNGQIEKEELPLTERDIYFNFTGNNFTYRLQALVTGYGSNLPARIWVPTDAGTQGQVLISTGGNAPVWASVDTEMSSGSTNMVQNKVIKSYVDTLVGDINTILQSI